MTAPRHRHAPPRQSAQQSAAERCDGCGKPKMLLNLLELVAGVIVAREPESV